MSLPSCLARAASRCICSCAASSAWSGAWGATSADHPLPCQRVADTVRAATEPSAPSEGESSEMLTRDSQCRIRIRPPLPTAATMRARTMIDAMTGKELPAEAAVTERGGAVSSR